MKEAGLVFNVLTGNYLGGEKETEKKAGINTIHPWECSTLTVVTMATVDVLV